MKIIAFILFASVTACSTTPTGRSQLKLVGSSQMDKMGDSSFSELQKKTPVSNDPKLNKQVLCVTNALLPAMGENPANWDVKVFNDESPNAFALPGNNIGVHTGILKLVENQHQLAAIIGHEVGHVKANHGNERVSQGLVVQAGMIGAQLALGNDSKTDSYILGAIGVGAQFGILLPFSRRHESEADYLGLRYMARAGFDPREAAGFWRVMKRATGGKAGPELLSTHPSPDTRIKDLSQQAGEYIGTYESNPNQPFCF